MNNTLMEGLNTYNSAYIDDIIIYGTKVEHKGKVKTVLTKLRDADLQVNLDKCKFSVTETKFLGLIISTSGIWIDPKKINDVVNWPAPEIVTQVQRFTGFTNFYRRFIEGYSRLTKPLNELTQKDRKFE